MNETEFRNKFTYWNLSQYRSNLSISRTGTSGYPLEKMKCDYYTVSKQKLISGRLKT
jgi:hypothetical protein